MGKREVHVVTVRKPVTIVLLVVVTALLGGLIYGLSGKAYAADSDPVREILARLLGSGSGPVSRSALLAFLMPVIANVLLFVPWGFLSFVALDSPARRRRASYAITFVAALMLAAAMQVWQEFLPTRVTSLPDSIANALGALGGAALGQARKDVRVRFDF
jgi:VanZ family protein